MPVLGMPGQDERVDNDVAEPRLAVAGRTLWRHHLDVHRTVRHEHVLRPEASQDLDGRDVDEKEFTEALQKMKEDSE